MSERPLCNVFLHQKAIFGKNMQGLCCRLLNSGNESLFHSVSLVMMAASLCDTIEDTFEWHEINEMSQSANGILLRDKVLLDMYNCFLRVHSQPSTQLPASSTSAEKSNL